MTVNPKDHLDLLLHIERLMEDINKRMNSRSRLVLKRYPLTFALLALFGVVAVSEGVKGILEGIPFLNSEPLYLLALGLVVLIILGLVYKKLDK